ncbi:MAG: integrase core domain-containing protein [Thermoplasmata archaeon]|nr:integrase core domain-containing protein [Thermoplasmata archaeon]
MPEVVHTDRGRQYMGRRFRRMLEEAVIKMSVGERGYRDNMLMERLWRSYKWECMYLREKVELKELKEVTKEWVEYYNKERPHQSLGYKTPDEVYYGEVSKSVMNKNMAFYCPKFGEHLTIMLQ